MNATVLLLLSLGQDVAPATKPTDWVVWAIEHQLQLDPALRPNYRYIAIPPWGKEEWQHSVTLALNIGPSRSPLQYKPEWIAGGWMAAVDLTRLATDPKHLANLIETWDSIATDEPYIHVDAANVVEGRGRAAVIAPHIQTEAAQLLGQLSSAPVPVYRADHFLVTALDAKYPEFRGYVKEDGSLINQVELFQHIGLDEKRAKQINGDIRAATLHSMNTGHQRRVDIYSGLLARFNDGRIYVTRDPRREEKDPGRLPFASLEAFVQQAREIIYELPNGMHGYALTDGKGQLVREADPNVASDELVPSPFPKILSGAVSCIRCHGSESGLRTIKHDVSTLLRSGTQILFDVGNSGLTQAEVRERLLSLYGNPEIFDKKMERTREDLNTAVYSLTNGYFAKEDPFSVPRAFAAIAKINNDYRYQLVTPGQALLELGWQTEGDPVAALNRVLGATVSEVSITEAALRAGLPVLRTDFEVAYLDLATKASAYK